MNKAALRVLVLMLLAVSVSAERKELNSNGDFELGVLGETPPGYKEHVYFDPETVFANPDLKFAPETVQDTERGRCMKIKGLDGIYHYNVNLTGGKIKKSGQATISFYAKVGPGENGKLNPERKSATRVIRISSRLLSRRQSKSKIKGFIPIQDFVFRPTEKWQKFTFPCKVYKNAVTYAWLNLRRRKGFKGMNTIYFNDIKFVVGEGKVAATEEAALNPDKSYPVYLKGKKIKLNVRALLTCKDAPKNARIIFRNNNRKELYKTVPVKLKKAAKQTLKDGRTIYTADLIIPADRYGSFTGVMEYEGKENAKVKVRTLDATFATLHPVINHKRYSPGWGLGANYQPNLYWFKKMYIRINKPFNEELKILRLGGISLLRIWAHWRLVEPEEGKMTADYLGNELKLYEKSGFGIMFQLGGYMGWEKGSKMFTLPLWAYKKHIKHISKLSSHKAVLPPLKAWKNYVQFCVDHFGKYVKADGLWEVINEANCYISPEVYLKMLKASYDIVKKKYPKSIVIGNGMTGDFGLNNVEWCNALLKTDPNYENYLDGFAFHPYTASLDYQKGSYNKFSNLIKGIKSVKKPKTTLWNTECYMHDSATKNQYPYDWTGRSTIGGGDHLRHFLLNYLHGVKAVTAMTEGNYNRGDTPNDALAAGNALSWFLKDMDRIIRLDEKINRFLRAGVCTSNDCKKGFGFIWDLRPSGSNWIVPEKYFSGLKFFDLYGNPITVDKSKGVFLSLDPVFVKGNPGTIRLAMLRGMYASNNEVKLNARIFQDKLVLEAENFFGTDCHFDAAIEKNKWFKAPERIMFAYKGNMLSSVVLDNVVSKRPGKDDSVKWTLYTDGDESGTSAVNILPDTGSYSIPSGSAKPLTLPIGDNAVARIKGVKAGLKIEVDVTDEKVVASEDKRFYLTDAVEIFIDTNPFYSLSQKDIKGSQKLNVFQYFLAATPAKDGSKFWAANKVKGEFKSNAVYKNEKTDDGYRVSVIIPWGEIAPMFAPGDVFGIDIEISDKDDIKDECRTPKQSLGGKPGKSYLERLHYPLFRLPKAALKYYRDNTMELFGGGFIKGGDFEGKLVGRGVLEGWDNHACQYIPQPRYTKIIVDDAIGKGYGYLGSGGVYANVQESAARAFAKKKCRAGYVNQSFKVKKNAHKRAAIQFMYKLEDMKTWEPGYKIWDFMNQKPGFYNAIHFWPSRINNRDPNFLGIQGTTGWRLGQIILVLPAGTDKIGWQTGYRNPVTGKLWLDNIKFKYLD